MKKKLLFASYNLAVGGIEKSLVNLVNSLDYAKYEVTVYLQIKEGEFLSDLNPNVIVKGYDFNKNKCVFIRKIRNISKYLGILLKSYHKYDFSAAYGSGYIPSTLLAYFASKNNASWMHTNIITFAKNAKWLYRAGEDAKITAKRFLRKIYFRKFKRNVFVSNNAKEAYLSLYPNDKDKCYVVHNIIDYKSILEKSKEKIDYDFNKLKRPVFINIGRHTEFDKKLSRLIDACKKLKKDYDFSVLMIGDGAEHQIYLEQTKNSNLNNIIFLGQKSNPFPYLKQADAFLLCSQFEGYPTTFLESMVLNKPIITTNVSDALLDIKDKFGIVVENNDTDFYLGIKEYLDKSFNIKKKFSGEEYNCEILTILGGFINEE